MRRAPGARRGSARRELRQFPSKDHHDRRMVAQLLVERVELPARARAHDAGEAEVLSLAARAHLDRGGLEIRSMLEHDCAHRLREPRLLAAHDLDGKVAGKRGWRIFLGHPQRGYAYTASPPLSMRPARITFRLNSW